MRSWDIRYAAPCDKRAYNRSAQELQLLTAALADRKVQIPTLIFHNREIDYSLEAGGLNLSIANDTVELNAGLLSFRYLTSFDLKVFVRGSDRFTQSGELLPVLLSNMSFLKNLSIKMCGIGLDESEPSQLRCMCASIQS